MRSCSAGLCSGVVIETSSTLADHSARVLARCARFCAEARCERRDTDRQLRLVGDLLAHEVGEGHFGGGDEPKIVSIF